MKNRIAGAEDHDRIADYNARMDAAWRRGDMPAYDRLRAELATEEE